jgi:hypothetical protein
MLCRRCNRRFDPGTESKCPYCGASNGTAPAGLLKASTILISAGETDAVYHDMEEVPDPLRKKLVQSTNGLNSATILIADRRGRDEVVKAIRKLPVSMQRRLADSVLAGSLNIAPSRRYRLSIHQAIGLVVVFLSAVLVWLLFWNRW